MHLCTEIVFTTPGELPFELRQDEFFVVILEVSRRADPVIIASFLGQHPEDFRDALGAFRLDLPINLLHLLIDVSKHEDCNRHSHRGRE